ncbi:MAG: methyltransferase domain-containing protein [Puniceicoccaceae bacterium]
MADESINKAGVDFWEGRWQSGEVFWDHGRAAPPFMEFIGKKEAPSGKVLIPGCGSGHDVRSIAEFGAEVTGMDIAPTALEVARRDNAHPRASYIIGNILDPDPEHVRKYDWVLEHTCLCALPPHLWSGYAAGIRKVLKPGGHYLAIFYRNPHDDGGPPFRIEEEQILELFGDGFTVLDRWIPEQSYESRVGREEIWWFKFA